VIFETVLSFFMFKEISAWQNAFCQLLWNEHHGLSPQMSSWSTAFTEKTLQDRNFNSSFSRGSVI